MQHTPSNLNPRRKRRGRSLPVYALLCLLLVFVQGTALVHHHEGDLQRQLHCDICLKVGAVDHAIAAAEFYVAVQISRTTFESVATPTPFRQLPAFRARAPPANA